MGRGGLGGWRLRSGGSDGDGGFTVVEMVVALSLIAIVMAGLAPAFDGALQAAATGNHRTVANGLAVQATEALRALDYNEVGYSTATPAPGQCAQMSSTGTDPVTGSTSPATGETPVTVTTSGIDVASSQTIDNLTYHVVPCVFWASSSAGLSANGNCSGAGGTCPGAYKQSVVDVYWTDSAGYHTMQDVSAVYPGGEGAYTTADNNYDTAGATTSTSVAGSLNPPTAVTVTAPADYSLHVSWTPPSSGPAPTGYLVEYSTSSSMSGATPVSVTASTTAYDIPGLAAPAQYYVQVASVGSGQQSSWAQGNPFPATTTATTTTTAPATCTINAFSVYPTRAMVDQSGAIVGPVDSTGTLIGTPYENQTFALSASVSSVCSSAAVAVQYNTLKNTTASTSLAGSSQMTGTAGSAGTVWDAQSADAFTVYVNGVVSSPTTQVLVNICREKQSTVGSAHPSC